MIWLLSLHSFKMEANKQDPNTYRGVNKATYDNSFCGSIQNYVEPLDRKMRAEIRDDFFSGHLKYTVNRNYECISGLKSLKLGA